MSIIKKSFALAKKSSAQLLASRHIMTTNNSQSNTFFTIISQSEEAYRLTLGKNPVKLEPGFHIAIPLLHTVTYWDMRECPISVNELVAYTEDNVAVRISGTLFYKINNSYDATFNVSGLVSSIESLGESAMRSVVGNFAYDEIIADRQRINEQLCNSIGNACQKWGTSIIKFEIQSFLPANKDVEHQLEKQLEAERNRRKQLLDTESAINVAEGKRKVVILESEGALIAAKNLADSERYTLETKSAALAGQLNTLTKALGSNELAVNYLVELQRLEHLKNLAAGKNNTVYFTGESSDLPKMRMFADMMNKKE